MWTIIFGLFFVAGASSQATKEDLHEVPGARVIACDDEWFPFENMCYKVGGSDNNLRMNFEDADKKCKEYGGRLATVHSQELNDFLEAFLLIGTRTNVWIGLRRNGTAYDSWADRSPVDYTNWNPQQPSFNSYGREERCVEMLYQSWKWNLGGRAGMWNDYECDAENQFICEKTKVIQTRMIQDPRFCPGGGWKLDVSCFHVVNETMPWQEAEDWCSHRYQDGHLASISDRTVNAFFDYLLRKNEHWIGIKIKEGVQQQWTTGSYASNSHWAADVFEVGTCAFFVGEGTWNTQNCSRSLPFVCETSDRRRPPVVPNEDGDALCPDATWRDVGGPRCYYFDTESWVQWETASFMCMRQGGTLASIHSQEELDILQKFVLDTQKRLHIGLFRSTQLNDAFAWEDGSPLDFEKWAVGEPRTPKQECAVLWTDQMEWRNEDCGLYAGFICSAPKIVPNKTEEMELQRSSTRECLSGFTSSSVIGLAFCIGFVALLIGVVVYYFRLCDRQKMTKGFRGTRAQTTSTTTGPTPVREIVVSDVTYSNLRSNRELS